MSSGHKPVENAVSLAQAMRWAKAELVRKYLSRPREVNASHRVPYVAGYSEDGSTVYVDHRLPQRTDRGLFLYRPGPIVDQLWVSPLLRHETLEKALMDALKLDYARAHAAATKAEQVVVEARGFSWRAYNVWFEPWIKLCQEPDSRALPADLDNRPYQQSGLFSRKLRQAESIPVKGAPW